MMDIQYLETFVRSPEFILGATAIGSAVIGYITGKATSDGKIKLAEFDRDRYVAEQETKRAAIELDRARESSKLDLERVRFENSDAELARMLEKIAREREYGQADLDRKANEMDRLRKHQLDMAARLAELKPVLESYLCNQLHEDGNGADLEYLKTREEYRRELVAKWEKQMEEDGNSVFSEDIPMDEDKERINALVDMKFPLPNKQAQSRIPEEIKNLIDIVISE
jgi:hypothetical protein